MKERESSQSKRMSYDTEMEVDDEFNEDTQFFSFEQYSKKKPK